MEDEIINIEISIEYPNIGFTFKQNGKTVVYEDLTFEQQSRICASMSQGYGFFLEHRKPKPVNLNL